MDRSAACDGENIRKARRALACAYLIPDGRSENTFVDLSLLVRIVERLLQATEDSYERRSSDNLVKIVFDSLSG